MKRILNEDSRENTLVHVVMRGSDGEEYECVGVLMREDEDTIRIAFNAKDDVVVDYYDIQKRDVISIEVIDVPKLFS